jgi:hypothetical protein
MQRPTQSTRVSEEVEKEVVRRFPQRDVAGVLAALAALNHPPADGEWARTRARVQLALVILAQGDARALAHHLQMAKRDWRDTLCEAGLENINWPDVLRAAGFLVPR